MHIFDGKRDNGIIWQNGPKLKKNRKFIIHTMKQLGLGKHSLYMAIQVNIYLLCLLIYILIYIIINKFNYFQDEARQMVNIFLKLEGAPVNPKFTIYSSVSNMICSMIFNERLCVHCILRVRVSLMSSVC